jgi:hypothetical protein
VPQPGETDVPRTAAPVPVAPSAPAPAAPPAPDTTPPTISVGELPAVINGFEGCLAVGFTVTATDASGVTEVSAYDDHPLAMVWFNYRVGDDFVFDSGGLSGYDRQAWTTSPQPVTVVITAVDGAGNQASETRTFNYYDWVSYCTDAV